MMWKDGEIYEFTDVNLVIYQFYYRNSIFYLSLSFFLTPTKCLISDMSWFKCKLLIKR